MIKEIKDIIIKYDLNSLDYYDLNNRYDINIFSSPTEMKEYFNDDRFASIDSINNSIDKLNYFEEYSIIHFASCFGTADTIELDVNFNNDNIVFNFNIITHASKDGSIEEGIFVESHFFIIENEVLDKYENPEYIVSYLIVRDI